MRDIFGTIDKILGYLFAALLIGYTSWLTFLLAEMLIPEQLFLQVMTLILFDGAALIWFITFLSVARGTLQWAFAFVGFVVGLLGTVIMAGGELVLGQQLVVVEDPDRIGWILIATLIIAALVHVTLIYLFHFSDPHLVNRIETAQKVGKAIQQAGKDARDEIDRQMPELTANLVNSMLNEAQQQIDLMTAWHIRRSSQLQARAGEVIRGGDVIEGKARDVEQKPPTPPAAPKEKPGAWLGATFGSLFKPREPVTYASETKVDPEPFRPAPKAEPEPTYHPKNDSSGAPGAKPQEPPTEPTPPPVDPTNR